MSAKALKKTAKKKAAKKKLVKKKPTKKKVTKKKVTKKKVAKKKVVKKKAAPKVARKVAKKKVAKKKAAKKKAAPKAPKKVAKKKAAPKVTKKVARKKPAPEKAPKKQPLTAAEKKERAAIRTAQRKFIRESEKRLVARRAALIEAYHSAKGNTKASTAGGTEDYIDYAVSSYERDFSLSLTELERRQLLLVEDALRRVRAGEYGRCLNCGVSVPQRRLEVEAWARYCIPCQELDDEGMLEDPGFESDDDTDEPKADDREADEEA